MSSLADMLRATSPASGGIKTEAGLQVFSEEPVSLDVFIRDKKFLGNPPLSAVQYDAVRHIERVYLPDTYQLLAAEFDPKKTATAIGPAGAFRQDRAAPYWGVPYPMKNLITLQWGKGSSAPYTPVYNASTGQWQRLDEFKESLVASAYKDEGKVEAHLGTDSFHEGRGEMFRVRTRNGLEIDVWEGHRFLTWNRRSWPSGKRVAVFKEAKGAEWARLWDLQVGDPIAVTTRVPEPTSCVVYPDREVELIGLLLGDGCVSGSNYGSMVCGPDAQITRARIREVYESFPKTTVQEWLCDSGGSQRWKLKPTEQGGSHNTYSRSVRELITRLGLVGKTAKDKRVPTELFSLDNRQVALLVSRLIDTDGWVSISNTVEVGYGTISKGLAEDVQRLLLRLGAQASIQTKVSQYKGSPYTSYQVRVRYREGVETVLRQLSLLDKDAARLRALEWLEARASRKKRAQHGDLVWDRIASIESLGQGDYWTLSVDGPACYITSGGILDHNSGKDHICRVSSMRVAYLLMCLRSPQEYYEMPSQDTIHLLNVASTSGQALEAFFKPITRAVQRGWFADMAAPHVNTISYRKNIECISGHSDAESQEGLNLMLGVADEIDAFKSSMEIISQRGKQAREPTKSAEAILQMLRTSGATRFPSVYKQVSISFPRYQGSKIQQLTAIADKDVAKKGDASRHYVSGPLATWEVNPRVAGKEVFADDYEDDPVMARGKYECRPGRSQNPYFRNAVAVEERLCLPEAIAVNYACVSGSWVPRYTFAEDFVPIKGARYAMHGDLAVTGDRAGIAMAHVVGYDEFHKMVEGEDGTEVPFVEQRPQVKVDFVIGFEASARENPPREIQIRWARQLCFELIGRGFPIKSFTFDGFESRDTMQILESRGVESKRLSTDLTDMPWKTLADLLYEGRAELPDSALLLTELLTLTKLPNGKVDHLLGGSKDLADAVACAVVGAVTLGGSEDPSGDRSYYEPASFVVGGSSDARLRGTPSTLDLPLGFDGLLT